MGRGRLLLSGAETLWGEDVFQLVTEGTDGVGEDGGEKESASVSKLSFSAFNWKGNSLCPSVLERREKNTPFFPLSQRHTAGCVLR